MIVPGLTSAEIESVEAGLEMLNKGIQSRQVGATNMHEHSSRSHLVVKIEV